MAPFEFTVTIPADGALPAMIRNIVAHGARHAGSPDDAALEFACRVEDAVRAMIGDGAGASEVTVDVRLTDGPLQVVVTGGAGQRTFSLDR